MPGTAAPTISGDRLIAVLTSYARADDDDAMTTVEAVEDGWWYTCPIPNHRRVVAFLTDGDLLAARLRTGTGFDRHAHRTTHIALLGPTTPETPPRRARLSHVPRATVRRRLAGSRRRRRELRSAVVARHPYRGADGPGGCPLRRPSPRRTQRGTEAIVARYEAERRATYRLEQRWPIAPFWARRHISPDPLTLRHPAACGRAGFREPFTAVVAASFARFDAMNEAPAGGAYGAG